MDEKLAVVNDVIFGNLANFWEAFSFEQRYELICCRSLRPLISEPRLCSSNYGHRSLVPRRFWMTKTTLKWIIPNSSLFFILSKIVYIKNDLMSKLPKTHLIQLSLAPTSNHPYTLVLNYVWKFIFVLIHLIF